MSYSKYLKLFGAVLDGDTHNAIIVRGDGIRKGHFDGIVVVVVWIADVFNLFVATKSDIVRHGHQLQWLMSPTMVYIREPMNSGNTQILISLFVSSLRGGMGYIIFGNSKFSISTCNRRSYPHFIILYQWKDFLIGDTVLISYD